jgi:hypothetical protein
VQCFCVERKRFAGSFTDFGIHPHEGKPMTDILSFLWTLIAFLLGLIWDMVWFVLRDLLSSLVWIALAIWAGFVVRHRSVSLGTMSLLRNSRHGLFLFWRWLRGKPQKWTPSPVKSKKRDSYRIPWGYVSLSEELNVFLVIMFITLLKF